MHGMPVDRAVPPGNLNSSCTATAFSVQYLHTRLMIVYHRDLLALFF